MMVIPWSFECKKRDISRQRLGHRVGFRRLMIEMIWDRKGSESICIPFFRCSITSIDSYGATFTFSFVSLKSNDIFERYCLKQPNP